MKDHTSQCIKFETYSDMHSFLFFVSLFYFIRITLKSLFEGTFAVGDSPGKQEASNEHDSISKHQNENVARCVFMLILPGYFSEYPLSPSQCCRKDLLETDNQNRVKTWLCPRILSALKMLYFEETVRYERF